MKCIIDIIPEHSIHARPWARVLKTIEEKEISAKFYIGDQVYEGKKESLVDILNLCTDIENNRKIILKMNTDNEKELTSTISDIKKYFMGKDIFNEEYIPDGKWEVTYLY